MSWLDEMIEKLDERARGNAEKRRRWLASPEGQRQAADWQAEDSRYGDR